MVTVLVAMSGCTTGAPQQASPTVPLFTSSTAQPTTTNERMVPRACAGLATLSEVVDILGTAVTGQTLPVVGVPEPKIGRTARLDCYYGVPDGQPTSAANVWIGLASYTDEVAAKRRMEFTVDAERETGTKPTDAPVGPDRGVLFTGERHTLIAVRGKNTAVVVVIAPLVQADQAPVVLGRLADRALTPR
jgi:hypothetical protein